MTLETIILPLHITAAVVAFGATFAYPVLVPSVAHADPRALPALHRAQENVTRRLSLPALGVVIVSGLYLAGTERVFGEFWAQWPIGAAFVLGAIGGRVLAPSAHRLADLAQRDIASARDGEVELGAEYRALARRVAVVGALANLLVLATIYVMTAKP